MTVWFWCAAITAGADTGSSSTWVKKAAVGNGSLTVGSLEGGGKKINEIFQREHDRDNINCEPSNR
jgi:hypothetical protein